MVSPSPSFWDSPPSYEQRLGRSYWSACMHNTNSGWSSVVHSFDSNTLCLHCVESCSSVGGLYCRVLVLAYSVYLVHRMRMRGVASSADHSVWETGPSLLITPDTLLLYSSGSVLFCSGIPGQSSISTAPGKWECSGSFCCGHLIFWDFRGR